MYNKLCILIGGIVLKIKDNFLLKEVAGKTIVVPVGQATLDFNAIITLNETGAFLFSKLQEKDMSEEDLVAALTTEYDVSADIAAADIKKFVDSIKKAGVTE